MHCNELEGFFVHWYTLCYKALHNDCKVTLKLGDVIDHVSLKLGDMIYHVTLKLGDMIDYVTLKVG